MWHIQVLSRTNVVFVARTEVGVRCALTEKSVQGGWLLATHATLSYRGWN